MHRLLIRTDRIPHCDSIILLNSARAILPLERRLCSCLLHTCRHIYLSRISAEQIISYTHLQHQHSRRFKFHTPLCFLATKLYFFYSAIQCWSMFSPFLEFNLLEFNLASPQGICPAVSQTCCLSHFWRSSCLDHPRPQLQKPRMQWQILWRHLY
jgi:hypothetical protein